MQNTILYGDVVLTNKFAKSQDNNTTWDYMDIYK